MLLCVLASLVIGAIGPAGNHSRSEATRVRAFEMTFGYARGRTGLESLWTTIPSGAPTRFEYNAFNLVTKVIDPLTGETSFSYDGMASC